MSRTSEPAPPGGGASYLAPVVIGIGIPAAIALGTVFNRTGSPDLSETRAIVSMRDVVTAGVAYADANGHYDTLECLIEPSSCIPGYSGKPERFLEPKYAQSVRSNYEYRFYPGPLVTGLDPRRASPSSRDDFAYVAVPVVKGRGYRAFCGGSSGIICEWKNGQIPRIIGGRCPPDCTPIS